MSENFSQNKQRTAEFIKPDGRLKSKIGTGGLDEKILKKAQALVENNTYDFTPMAMRYITAIGESIKIARNEIKNHDTDSLISIIISPALQIKANAGMFGYPLMTKITHLMIGFLERIHNLDNDAFEILDGFATALNAVLIGDIRDNNQSGQDLYLALEDACNRYLKRL